MVNGQWSNLEFAKINRSLINIFLQIIPGISFCRPHIFAHIPPEGQHQVNDDGGAHGEEGSINKILPDLACGDTHPVADGRTNAKGIPFNEAF